MSESITMFYFDIILMQAENKSVDACLDMYLHKKIFHWSDPLWWNNHLLIQDEAVKEILMSKISWIQRHAIHVLPQFMRDFKFMWLEAAKSFLFNGKSSVHARLERSYFLHVPNGIQMSHCRLHVSRCI